jgi:hypothetical protein
LNLVLAGACQIELLSSVECHDPDAVFPPDKSADQVDAWPRGLAARMSLEHLNEDAEAMMRRLDELPTAA